MIKRNLIMATLKKETSRVNSKKANVSAAAAQLLNESKKLANELYEEGIHRVNDYQDNAKEYSDKALEKVRQNPLTSVLVAAGVGFLLSSILRK